MLHKRTNRRRCSNISIIMRSAIKIFRCIKAREAGGVEERRMWYEGENHSKNLSSLSLLLCPGYPFFMTFYCFRENKIKGERTMYQMMIILILMLWCSFPLFLSIYFASTDANHLIKHSQHSSLPLPSCTASIILGNIIIIILILVTELTVIFKSSVNSN